MLGFPDTIKSMKRVRYLTDGLISLWKSQLKNLG